MITEDELHILQNGFETWQSNSLLWSRAFKWYNENHNAAEQLLKPFTQTAKEDFEKVYQWCIDKYTVKLPRPIK